MAASYLDVASVYDGSYLKGKTVLVTGGNRGLEHRPVMHAVLLMGLLC